MKCKKCGNVLSDIEFMGGVCSKCHSVLDKEGVKGVELGWNGGVKFKQLTV